MKKLFNYIPSICMCFTLGTLVSAINNLFSGYTAMGNKGILEFFVMILVIHIVICVISSLEYYDQYCCKHLIVQLLGCTINYGKH